MENKGFWLPFTQMKNIDKLPKVVKGEGLYLYLEDGTKLMDCISSWWVTIHGHSNEIIADAIAKQAKTLEHVISAGFLHDKAIELSGKLISLMPENIDHLFYSDNGSTAVEVGLKMVFQYWKNKGDKKRTTFISFQNGYHGDTIGAMSVGGRSIFTDQFKELLFDTVYLPYPSTFIGDENPENEEDAVIAELDRIIETKGSEIAGLIIEPLVQGAGGMNMCRPEFLQKLEKRMKKAGIPVIYDEVMTGFGRTGEIFACIKAKTNPDVVCLSKGITGGFMPLAATLCTDEIYSSFLSDDPLKTFFHGHSYTANPLGCAAGVASIDLLMDAQPYKKIEAWHRENLFKFREIKLIEKMRICGTIAAFDVKASEKGYLSDIGKKIKPLFLKRGLVLRPLGNVLYILPPYCIKREELDFVYDQISEVLSSLS